jgi:hypothetical protein
MYEVKLFMNQGDITHYVKVNEEDLQYIRDGVGDPISPDFIEVYCHDDGSVFGFSKEELNAYSYKEVVS